MKTIETINSRPFKRLVVGLGELPTSFLESMTYYELLAWFCNFLQEKVIPTVNNNAEAVEEVQKAFTDLKDYVDHYFDDLDISAEVDAKLDEMAESGELQEIIAQYLSLQTSYAFDNVSDLVAAENLTDGSLAQTYGFYTVGDGGGAKYQIRTVTSADTPDNITLFALTNAPTLVAELVADVPVNIRQGGARPEDESEDFDNSQIINTLLHKYNQVLVPDGTYLCNTITLWSGNEIVGHSQRFSVLKCNAEGASMIVTPNDGSGESKIQNITIYGDSKAAVGLNLNLFTNNASINRVEILRCGIGLKVTQAWYMSVSECDIHHCDKCVEISTENGEINSIMFTNCWMIHALTNYACHIKNTNNRVINALKFNNCTFESTPSHGLYVESTVPQATRNILLSNCYFENNDGNCIDGAGWMLKIENSYFHPKATTQTDINSAFDSIMIVHCFEEADVVPSMSLTHSGNYAFIDGFTIQGANKINLTNANCISYINNAYQNALTNQVLSNPKVTKNISYNGTGTTQMVFGFNDSAFDADAPYHHTIKETAIDAWTGSKFEIVQHQKGGTDYNVVVIGGRVKPLFAVNNDTTFRIPRGATSDRPTANLSAGVLFFDTTLNKLMVYDGSAWQQV